MTESANHSSRISQAPSLTDSSARRTLFPNENVPPHVSEFEQENELNLIQEQFRKNFSEAKKRWNFDFDNEVALEGDWEWEKVEVGESNKTPVLKVSKETDK